MPASKKQYSKRLEVRTTDSAKEAFEEAAERLGSNASELLRDYMDKVVKESNFKTEHTSKDIYGAILKAVSDIKAAPPTEIHMGELLYDYVVSMVPHVAPGTKFDKLFGMGLFHDLDAPWMLKIVYPDKEVHGLFDESKSVLYMWEKREYPVIRPEFIREENIWNPITDSLEQYRLTHEHFNGNTFASLLNPNRKEGPSESS